VCAIEVDLPSHDVAHRCAAFNPVDRAGEIELALHRKSSCWSGENSWAGSPAAIQPIGTVVSGSCRELTCTTALIRTSLPWPAIEPGNSDAPVARNASSSTLAP
jgi:hypothetical protein